MNKKVLSKELRWVLSYMKPYMWGILGVLVLTFAKSYSIVLIPTVSVNFLFELITPEKVYLLKKYFILAAALIVAKSLFEFLRSYSTRVIIHSILRNIRDTFFNKLMELDLDYFVKNKTGDIISIAINDIEKIQDLFYKGVVNFLSSTIMAIVLLTKLFLLNWQLTLVALGVLPAMYILIRIIGNRLRSVGRRLRKKLADLSINFHETITGIQVVKAFTQEKAETEKFQTNTKKYRKIIIKLGRLMSAFGPMTEVVLYVFAMILIGIGATLIWKELWSAKQMTEYLILLGILSAPIIQIPRYISNFKIASASIERVTGVLDIESRIKEKPNPVQKVIGGKIEFKNVYFSYDSENIVLDDIRFVAERGDIIALVGPSGAGKSTIINLIPRFYDCVEGSIFVDDIDVRDFSLKSLRSQIGIVSQDVFLFNASIYDNICYAKMEATLEEIETAAHKAYAYDFIMDLPEQFETNVGEKGVRLSGGQKQRIAIARTILRNPHILILDEATSALDSESEQYIKLAINELMNGRTTITIAHRLSTITHATKILYIDKGKIIAVGTHAELLKSCEQYRKIYDLQYFRQ